MILLIKTILAELYAIWWRDSCTIMAELEWGDFFNKKNILQLIQDNDSLMASNPDNIETVKEHYDLTATLTDANV